MSTVSSINFMRISGLGDEASIAHLSEAERSELRADRIGAVFKLTPVSVVGNLANMVTLAELFRASENNLFLGIWALVTVAVLARWINAWWLGRRNTPRQSASIRTLRRLISNTVIIGALWGVPILYLFPGSSPSERAILFCVAAGMITGGAMTLATVWQAALAYSLMIVLPLSIAVLRTQDPTYNSILFFSAAYFMIIGFVVYERSQLFVDSRLAIIRLRKLGAIREEQLRDLQENSDDILWELDALGHLRGVSNKIAMMFGSTAEKLEGVALAELLGVTPDKIVFAADNINLRYLHSCLRNQKIMLRRTITVRIAGHSRCWAIRGKPIFDSAEQCIGFRGTLADITEALRAQEATDLVAQLDFLTGLPNRLFLQHHVDMKIHEARGSTLGFSLLTLDLDDFKTINDSCGHAVGDELLRQCADRMQGCLRPGELVSRYGGDEFVIVLQEKTHELATAVALRLIKKISEPYSIDGRLLHVGASAGVAIAPLDGISFKELLRNSDRALYRSKAEGKGKVSSFSPELNSSLMERRQMELDLRKALGTSQIRLNFQPIINLQNGCITTCETLVRWAHPERGAVSPTEFVSVAEDSGLIVELGTWILNEACRQALHWPRNIRVAVNVSPVQFRCENFLQQVKKALYDNGLPPERLEVEITESVLITARHETLQTLNALRGMGVRVSLDDFGTGYSSLAYLSDFPFDKLKIDQSFVRNLTVGSVGAAIVRAIIDLAAALNISSTAEGVETEAQMQLLRDQGCNEAQGYLFSRPVSAEDITLLLGTPASSPQAAREGVAEPVLECASTRQVA